MEGGRTPAVERAAPVDREVRIDWRVLFGRFWRALRLDASVYPEVVRDPAAARQAAWVVRLVSAAAAVGTFFLVGWHVGAVLAAVVAAVAHWLVWAGVTVAIVRWVFHREASMRPMLSAMGFAQAPLILAALAFIPWLGPVIAIAVRVLGLLAGHQAIEQVTGLERRGTLTITAIAFILGLGVTTLLKALFVDIGPFEALLRP